MTVEEAIRKRYSCRAYLERAIEPEKMAKLIEAARLAPSAKNIQDWRFVIVTDKEKRLQIADAAYEQMFIARAGAVIVACSDSDYVMRCGQKIGPVDVSIALENIALQATELGLASCWIGSFYPEKVRAILGIPEKIEVIEIMPIGYPADRQPAVRRIAAEKIACWEKWGF